MGQERREREGGAPDSLPLNPQNPKSPGPNPQQPMQQQIREHDGMLCRACGNEERASEGYPCAECGTFVCLLCTFRGVTLCKACEGRRNGAGAGR